MFVIGDLHLSLGESEKPMDIFKGWENHAQRIAQSWDENVKETDTVIIPGDLSWAMNLDEAAEDFRFVQNRPGKKIILKGNHDYYWTTMKKMQEFLDANHFDTISILHNNSILCEGVSICGTRGWMAENSDAFNKKIIEREAQRLETSLASAKEGMTKLVFLHYPPFDREGKPILQLLDVLERHRVSDCWFGHLHGQSIRTAPVGTRGGIRYHLVSADALGFQPLKILL